MISEVSATVKLVYMVDIILSMSFSFLSWAHTTGPQKSCRVRLALLEFTTKKTLKENHETTVTTYFEY